MPLEDIEIEIPWDMILGSKILVIYPQKDEGWILDRSELPMDRDIREFEGQVSLKYNTNIKVLALVVLEEEDDASQND